MLVCYFGFKRIIHPKCLLVYYFGFNRVHSSQVGSSGVCFGFKRIYLSKVSSFGPKRPQCVILYSSIFHCLLLAPKEDSDPKVCCSVKCSVCLYPQDSRLPWNWADRCSTLANWSRRYSPLVPETQEMDTRLGCCATAMVFNYGTWPRALQVNCNGLDSVTHPIEDFVLGPW